MPILPWESEVRMCVPSDVLRQHVGGGVCIHASVMGAVGCAWRMPLVRALV